MNVLLVLVCRQYLPGTTDDLVPGNILGHSCAICGRALQVRPSAMKHIEAGSEPLCNPCGYKFTEYMQQKIRPENVKIMASSEDVGNKVAEAIEELKRQK